MTTRPLPERPDLDQLRRSAKDVPDALLHTDGIASTVEDREDLG
ncbi:MAG TPA: hypothetical protein VE623_20345 [Acidimicrobiales bacterium]|nr:hypothetical protein [Acidimicrobiales bacterium]